MSKSETLKDKKMEAKQIFEQAIAQQEVAIREMFGEETSVASVCVGLGNAREIPGIDEICPGQDATWEGYRINRRRVDHLDNVYVSRA